MLKQLPQALKVMLGVLDYSTLTVVHASPE
jgi:hypothetical protein